MTLLRCVSHPQVVKDPNVPVPEWGLSDEGRWQVHALLRRSWIGDGGVGTLQYCHLAAVPIDRRLDQPGQGHYWTYDRTRPSVLHHLASDRCDVDE